MKDLILAIGAYAVLLGVLSAIAYVFGLDAAAIAFLAWMIYWWRKDRSDRHEWCDDPDD